MTLRVSYTFYIGVLFSGCSPSHNSVSYPGKQSISYEEYLAGEALYNQNCVFCHSPLEQSTKRNRSFGQIKKAISDLPQMNFLEILSDQQVRQIEMVLNNERPPKPDGFRDPLEVPRDDLGAPFDSVKYDFGKSLYTDHCSSCHSDFVHTTKRRTTFEKLVHAIKYIPQMKHLQSLNRDQISAIVYALNKTPETLDPADIKAVPKFGDRFFLHEKLLKTFKTGDSLIDGEVRTILERNIAESSHHLGGRCSYFNLECSPSVNQRAQESRSPFRTLNSVARQGIVSKTCQQLIEVSDQIVLSVLQKVDLEYKSEITSENVSKLVKLFLPDKQSLSEVNETLAQLALAMDQTKSGWRLAIVTICESGVWQIK